MPEVMFNGPEGRIEGRYLANDNNTNQIALVLHPHPLHGGTMNNKVVYKAYKALADSGFSVLRINFRGVGRSQGKFDNGIGELTDATTAIDWLQLQNPTANNFLIVGFSFGAWIAMQLLMRRPEIQGFIAISPPVGKYDFSFLSPCPAPGLVIQGDKDSIVKEEEVSSFVAKLNKQRGAEVKYNVIEDADHFFREKLDLLSQEIKEYLATSLSDHQPKRVKSDRRRKLNFDNFE